MAFYRADTEMASLLGELLNQLAKQGRPGLHKSIAITWIRYDCPNPESCSGIGTGWSEEKLIYPASVVKLIYAVAIEAWLQKDLLLNTRELQRAVKKMIVDSSNDATSLVLDLLSGTTSGPSLFGERLQAWQKQRLLVNEWLKTFNWAELKGSNCCQKTWEDGPYGREQDFYKDGYDNRNSLSTAATARMLEGVMTNGILSPPACNRLRTYLSRSLDEKHRKENPENQIDGFLGEGLPKGTRLWSKAGWMSQVRHDAAWCCPPKGNPMLLVIFSQGRQNSTDTDLLPNLAKKLINYHMEKDSS
ncbi:serine hydrolase [Prochlorococcus sp. MIT 1307]|uniref:serine hydrolase n=1 Tax=Prochlorococcus sp. MIT 1307 TaxID=3096219 RepID=UPI002A766082|nr:serine hydrolase [Prochlorococcus sp. MIT 1307]